jgi:hypothetical protein
MRQDTSTEVRKETVEGRLPIALGCAEAGALAGLIGGVLMAVWSMAYSAAVGDGALAPLRLIGATFVGEEALVGGAGTLLYGFFLHVLVAAAFGVVFALILRRNTTPGVAFLYGLAYAVAVMLVMTYLVTPIGNPVLNARIPMMSGSWIFEHLLYGAGISLVPVLRRRRAPQRPEVRRIPQPA